MGMDTALADAALKRLPLSKIRRDGDTHVRGLEPENVQRLVDVLESGGKFRDPPRVFFDGSDYWLSHGFHRVEAYQRHGIEKASFEVVGGTVEDARDDACRPHNAAHGLPETRDDRRRRAESLLRFRPKWSNNRLAKHLGMSDKTLKAYRDELAARSEIPNAETREDSSGRQQPASKPRAAAPPKTCPNCGGTSVDEDGDCTACFEPQGDNRQADDPDEQEEEVVQLDEPEVVGDGPAPSFNFNRESDRVYDWNKAQTKKWPADSRQALSTLYKQLSQEAVL